MNEKYKPKFEDKIRQLIENRVERKKLKVFDHNARIIKRQNFPELVDEDKTDHPNCLVIVSGEGETVIITQEFERVLFNAMESWLKE